MVVEAAPDFRLGREMYAWTLFDAIRQVQDLTPELLAQGRTVVQLCTGLDNAYSKVSPFVPTILRIARLLAQKGKFSQVLEWLHHLDPSRLDREEFAFTDPTGKHRTLASACERYHGLKTHALEKLMRWAECLDAAEMALSDCRLLHHDNDIWFARRVARAKINLGRHREGMAELFVLAARKPTSFIYCDIADAAWMLGDNEGVLRNCLLALQAPGEIGFKLAAVLLLAKTLWREGRKEEARAHLTLLIAYRKKRGWRIAVDVKATAEEWGCASEAIDVTALLPKLKASWQEWRSEREPRRNGVIQRMLPHGRAGFIVANNHERFYFDVRDFRDQRAKVQEGSPVTFATKPSFDRKRQKPSVVAYDIQHRN